MGSGNRVGDRDKQTVMVGDGDENHGDSEWVTVMTMTVKVGVVAIVAYDVVVEKEDDYDRWRTCCRKKLCRKLVLFCLKVFRDAL